MSPISRFTRAAIGRFHDGGATTRTDDEMALAIGIHRHACGACGKRARFVIIMRFGGEPFGNAAFVIGLGSSNQRGGSSGFRNSRRAIDDKHRGDLRFIEQQFRLEQFKLKAHRAQIIAQQKFAVLKGKAIGRAGCLRCRQIIGGKLGVFARLSKARTGILIIFGHLASPSAYTPQRQ